MLNLLECQNELKKYFGQYENWPKPNFQMTFEPNCLKVTVAGFSCDDYKGEFDMIINAYESGMVFLDFIFDKLFISETPLILSNTFNSESLFLSVNINPENEYLRVSHSAINIFSAKSVVDYVQFMFNELLDDDMVKLLQPLTDMTMSEQE